MSKNLPHLSQPQAWGLALWSYGLACTRTCGRLTVATFLAMLLSEKVGNVEQRLYEWCLDAGDKAGKKRCAIEVTACFVPLLSWIVRLWQGKQLALTLDATSLGERFVVLAVSVVYRGIGIPVAWCILPAAQQQAWRGEWLRLLRLLRPAIPGDWTVLVLADRGLYARWLFRRIVRLGWHPFLRINRHAKFRPQGQHQWYWLDELLKQDGHTWRGCGTAFVTHHAQLNCTLLAWWQEGYTDPWFILTDLPPQTCTATWYGLRAWCEQGFKCTKRGGWQWQQTRMTDPARAARLWLAFAVAMLWMVCLGSDLEGTPAPDLPDLPPLLATPHRQRPPRPIRLFRLGWLWLLVSLIRQQPLPLPTLLIPEPWPPLSPPQQPIHSFAPT